MFPRGLLLARVYRDEVRPVFLSPDSKEMLETATSLGRMFNEAIGHSRRELELMVRDQESKAEKFKVIRGLSLLLERDCTFRQRDGPEPAKLRLRMFDRYPGGVVTPEEREAALGKVAAEFGIAAEAVPELMWADLEDEYLLTGVPKTDPAWLIERFNMGQCQTLLFRCEHLSMSFEGEEAYREAIKRIKRAGLMFTASAGPPPQLEIEGVVSFLRSTERYGVRLAKLLPDLLTLPGWAMTAKVEHADSGGRKKVRTFRLSSEVSRVLGVGREEPERSNPPEVIGQLAEQLRSLGLTVEENPGPLVAGPNMEFPDLLVKGATRSVYVEGVGYWSKDWVAKKVKRTEWSEIPYFIVAQRDLSVDSNLENGRVVYVGKKGLEGEGVRGKILAVVGGSARSRSEPAPQAAAEVGAGGGSVMTVTQFLKEKGGQPLNRNAAEMMGYRVLGSFVVRKAVIDEVRKDVRAALPELEAVERALASRGMNASVLPHIGFKIQWRGLDSAEVLET